jgi:hypothetical protein
MWLFEITRKPFLTLSASAGLSPASGRINFEMTILIYLDRMHQNPYTEKILLPGLTCGSFQGHI